MKLFWILQNLFNFELATGLTQHWTVLQFKAYIQTVHNTNNENIFCWTKIIPEQEKVKVHFLKNYQNQFLDKQCECKGGIGIQSTKA